MLPVPPQITEEQLADCRRTGDFSPVLFEWYKFVGALCNFFARVQSDSPALDPPPSPRDYAVLTGLINRISRLMLSNVALSRNGLFGETTAIVDRCIFESAIKLIWLCETDSIDRFDRYVADGLKTELKFQETIAGNINERGRQVVIEARMLASIENHIRSSGMAAEEIAATQRLPDLAAMINAVRRHRLLYMVGQKIGSHHVHGTWPSLRLHYLEEADGVLRPRDHDCATHVNQYVFIPLIALDSLRSFVAFVFHNEEDREEIIQLLGAIEEEIMVINEEVVGRDFENVPEV